jgi:hypothetical protein
MVQLKIYRPVILPVALFGCETWSLTLREEHKLRVFENMVLRRIFGPEKDEVTGEWRKLHNEELNDLYSSPNIFRVIKSSIMRWAGHVARMGERRVLYRVLVGKPEGRKHLVDLDVDGSVTLQCIFKKWNGEGGHGLDESDSGWRQVAGSCERGHETSGSIKRGEFEDLLVSQERLRFRVLVS